MPDCLPHYLDTCPAAIRSTFTEGSYPPGALLLTQGDTPRQVFILTQGEASAYILTPNGIQYLEYIYTDEELFGEIEVLNDQSVLCNVVARSTCRVLQVDKGVFRDWMLADPSFALFICRQMADKLYQACQISVTHIVYPLRYRVLFFLWQAAQQGNAYVAKEDLIAGLGSNERSVNRIIKDLGQESLIEYDRGILKIGSKDAVIQEMSRYE